MDENLIEILKEKNKQVAIQEKKIRQQSQKAISARNKLDSLQIIDTLDKFMKKNEEVYSAVGGKEVAQKCIKSEENIIIGLHNAYMLTIEEQYKLNNELNQLVTIYGDIVHLYYEIFSGMLGNK